MAVQIKFLGELAATLLTLVGLDLLVHVFNVLHQVSPLRKGNATMAFEGSFPSMRPQVVEKFVETVVKSSTLFTKLAME